MRREDRERLKIVRNGVGKSLSERAYTPAQSESILADALSECEKQRDEYAAAVADLTAQRDQFRDAELMWERLMMELLGEDGPGSVRNAIEKLKGKVANYIAEARYHRDCERLCSREYDRIKQALKVFKGSYLEAMEKASQDDQLTLQNYMGYAAQEIEKVFDDDSN